MWTLVFLISYFFKIGEYIFSPPLVLIYEEILKTSCFGLGQFEQLRTASSSFKQLRAAFKQFSSAACSLQPAAAAPERW